MSKKEEGCTQKARDSTAHNFTCQEQGSQSRQEERYVIRSRTVYPKMVTFCEEVSSGWLLVCFKSSNKASKSCDLHLRPSRSAEIFPPKPALDSSNLHDGLVQLSMHPPRESFAMLMNQQHNMEAIGSTIIYPKMVNICKEATSGWPQVCFHKFQDSSHVTYFTKSHSAEIF